MPRRGKRRVKTRPQPKDASLVAPPGKDPAKAVAVGTGSGAVTVKKVPRSIVVRHGKHSQHLKNLVDDLRKVMNPYTANELRERRGASLKDYISIAPHFEVSHLLVLTQGMSSPNLKIARIPQGPTLTFRVERYALRKQIRSVQKMYIDSTAAFNVPPLVVLNNFEEDLMKEKRHLKIASLTFQSMFPAINVKTVKLSECKRVLLLNLNQDEETIEVRHYLIKTKPHGASKPIKRVLRSQVPDLSQAEDISEILDMHYPTSDSEFEEDSKVPVGPKGKPSRKAAQAIAKSGTSLQSVVKLAEIGPRLTLRVLKVEDGLFEGEVQYHAHKEKTKEEILQLRKLHEEQKMLKEARRLEQEENVKRKRDKEEEKRARKKAKKQKKLDGEQTKSSSSDDDDESAGEEQQENSSSENEDQPQDDDEE